MRPILYVGSKNYSSWSLRPYLALRWAGIDFEERVVPLGPRGAGSNPAIAAVSPTHAVPVLHLGDGRIVWDSLAICEWAAEERPEAGLWPQDRGLRTLARCATAEMHAGFARLRQVLPMNLRRQAEPLALPSDVQSQVERVCAVWAQCQAAAGGGPFLFGARPGIADAFYVPVASRFRSYGVSLSPAAQAYVEGVLGTPVFQAWERDALADPHRLAETDAV